MAGRLRGLQDCGTIDHYVVGTCSPGECVPQGARKREIERERKQRKRKREPPKVCPWTKQAPS